MLLGSGFAAALDAVCAAVGLSHSTIDTVVVIKVLTPCFEQGCFAAALDTVYAVTGSSLSNPNIVYAVELLTLCFRQGCFAAGLDAVYAALGLSHCNIEIVYASAFPTLHFRPGCTVAALRNAVVGLPHGCIMQVAFTTANRSKLCAVVIIAYQCTHVVTTAPSFIHSSIHVLGSQGQEAQLGMYRSNQLSPNSSSFVCELLYYRVHILLRTDVQTCPISAC